MKTLEIHKLHEDHRTIPSKLEQEKAVYAAAKLELVEYKNQVQLRAGLRVISILAGHNLAFQREPGTYKLRSSYRNAGRREPRRYCEK